MNVELRPFSSDNQDFLFQLYASTRIHEIAPFGWSPPQQEAFLRVQFNAQQGWYQQAYPQADHQIIFAEDQPIGRILVAQEAAGTRLVDIALLPEYRGRGIGTQLIRQLIEQATQVGSVVHLHVLRTNPAIHLYERLGFVKTSEDQMYYQMERTTSNSS